MTDAMSNKQAKRLQRLERFRARFAARAAMAERAAGVALGIALDADSARSKHDFARVKAVALVPIAAPPSTPTVEVLERICAPCAPNKHTVACMQVQGRCVNIRRVPAKKVETPASTRRPFLKHSDACMAKDTVICTCYEPVATTKRDPVAEYSGSVFKTATVETKEARQAHCPDPHADDEPTELGQFMWGMFSGRWWV